MLKFDSAPAICPEVPEYPPVSAYPAVRSPLESEVRRREPPAPRASDGQAILPPAPGTTRTREEQGGGRTPAEVQRERQTAFFGALTGVGHLARWRNEPLAQPLAGECTLLLRQPNGGVTEVAARHIACAFPELCDAMVQSPELVSLAVLELEGSWAELHEWLLRPATSELPDLEWVVRARSRDFGHAGCDLAGMLGCWLSEDARPGYGSYRALLALDRSLKRAFGAGTRPLLLTWWPDEATERGTLLVLAFHRQPCAATGDRQRLSEMGKVVPIQLEPGPELPALTPRQDGLLPLCRAGASGDRRALHALLAAVTPRMLNVVRRILGSAHPDAEDVTQDAAFAFVSRLSDFRGECTTLHFACRIAALTAMNARRRQRRVTHEPYDSIEESRAASDNPENSAHRNDLAAHIRELIDVLPEPLAEAFVLHTVLGYTTPELAEFAGVPFDTAKSRLRLARQALRRRVLSSPTLRHARGEDL